MEQLAGIQQYLSQSMPVNIEAGHFYLDDRETSSGVGASIAIKIINLCKERGVENRPIIFIDDWHNTPDLDSMGAALTAGIVALEEQGFGIQHNTALLFESDMYRPALEVIQRAVMRNEEILASLTITSGKARKKASQLVTSVGGLFIKEPYSRIQTGEGQPTCVALDAACYLHKHSTYPGLQVTVLPIDFQEQQLATQRLLFLIDEHVPILNIYFDQTGNIYFSTNI